MKALEDMTFFELIEYWLNYDYNPEDRNAGVFIDEGMTEIIGIY